MINNKDATNVSDILIFQQREINRENRIYISIINKGFLLPQFSKIVKFSLSFTIAHVYWNMSNAFGTKVALRWQFIICFVGKPRLLDSWSRRRTTWLHLAKHVHNFSNVSSNRLSFPGSSINHHDVLASYHRDCSDVPKQNSTFIKFSLHLT